MTTLPWIDLAIATILVISILLGLWRGVVTEVLSLLSWVAAFLAARLWGSSFAHALTQWSLPPEDPLLRMALAFVLVFVFTLVLFALLNKLITQLLRAVGLGSLDRLLGGVFGGARGLIILWLIVLAAGLTELPQHPTWREARLTAPLETAVIAGKPWLPRALAQKIRYRSAALQQRRSHIT